jgi:hypothetical protein
MISRGIHILVDEMFFYLAVGACLSDVFFADGPLVVLGLFLRTCVDGNGSLGGYIGGQAGWLARGGRESRLNRGDDKIRLRVFSMLVRLEISASCSWIPCLDSVATSMLFLLF